MNKIQVFSVSPSIPRKLAFLEKLSRNMWWCWNADAIELFRRLNPQLWRDVGHNPLLFLGQIPQERLESLAEEEGFLAHVKAVEERFNKEVVADACSDAALHSKRIAYFSLEYGIHESIRIYSGGLGGLAADHLKAASDVHMCMVGVGLMYRHGYFQQFLNKDGWQQEAYPENEIHLLPFMRAMTPDGKPVTVSVRFPEGEIKAAVWKLLLGNIPLYLLDANVPENPPEFRRITAQLYAGDRRMRLCQELLLGIGGYQALLAMGCEPAVCHMNEGHAGFMGLARLSNLVKKHGLSIEEAFQVVSRSTVFTTHTPVPAGNEAFATDLLLPYLQALQKDLGIDPATVIAWGRHPEQNPQYELNMTVLGLRMAEYRNGVSQLHGKVERKMWTKLWPSRPEDEIPIGHVTNGVHVSSWLSIDNMILYDRYFGPAWREHPSSADVLSAIHQIPDEEIWRAHELGRSRLIRTVRELLEKQFVARNATRSDVAQAKSVLDHDVLTIGFARRFATYKRAALLLKDPARLEAILSSDNRPVQIIFAGKAHPADDHGKALIQQIVQFARKPNMRRRIVFLENYDIAIARAMVQGVDVWLNTPRRPQEASGTSGMKAVVNGGLHLSVMDGWWCEGYNPECGWAIGHGEEYEDPEYQDTVESQALYNVIENEVVPCFYDRPSGDVPTRWARMVKASIRMGLSFFTSHRMVSEYKSMYYDQAVKDYESLMANNAAQAREFVVQAKRLNSLWPKVALTMPSSDRDVSMLHVGDRFSVTSKVRLGELKPDEIEVQVYYGPVNAENVISESRTETMTMAEDKGGGQYLYKCDLACSMTGRYGLTARVIPHGTRWRNSIPGFLTWADGN